MGGKGVFVKEVQAAVLDGRADFAVHSGKDLRRSRPMVSCSSASGEPTRDALVGASWASLSPGAHRHRFGSSPGPAGLASTRPRLLRAARQHSDSAGEARVWRLRRNRDGGCGDRPSSRSTCRSGRPARPGDHAPAGRPGRPRHRVPCGRHRDDRGAACDPTCRPRRVVDTEQAFLHELGGDCDLPAGARNPWGRRHRDHRHAGVA